MRVVSFVTQKGGAGKTTLAASVAVAAVQDGEKVAVLDLDPQRSLFTWAEGREADFPAVDALEAGRVNELPQIIEALKGQGYSLLILDTAGIDSNGTHTALRVSDLAILPSRPTVMDIRATKATHDAAVRLEKPFAFVLNQCPPQPNNPRAKEAASALSMFGVLALPMMMQRAAHQDAFAMGQGVTEYEPDGKAADEIRQLWTWIKNKMEGVRPHGKKTKLA